jgi:hypothetical protein
VAVATSVWGPVASELRDIGLAQDDALPLSSLHDTEVVFVVDHAKVAPVEVVEDGGVCVKLMVGAAAGAVIVQLAVARGFHFC